MLDEHMKYPKWQKPYLAALMEVKQPELSAKVEAAEAAVGGLGRRLGQSVIETAWGIHKLVNAHMAAAARIHVIEKSKDPRRYALLAFGGGGPVHGAGLARILTISRVVCPPSAGVASAYFRAQSRKTRSSVSAGRLVDSQERACRARSSTRPV